MAFPRLSALFALVLLSSCARDPGAAYEPPPPPGGNRAVAEPDRTQATNGGVNASQRAIVVISSLSTGISEDRAWIYRAAETLAVAQVRANLAKHYRTFIPLFKEEASLANFSRVLTNLSSDSEIRAIDVFIHVHGKERTLTFSDRTLPTNELAASLASIPGLSPKLRALYSAACFGASHAEDWLSAGFRVAAGSEGNNANTAYELPTFLGLWARGASYGEALTAGDSPDQRRIYDDYAIRLNLVETANSHKLIRGLGDVRINTLP